MNFGRMKFHVTYNLGNRSGITTMVEEWINSSYLDLVTTGKLPEAGKFAPIPCPALDGTYSFSTSDGGRIYPAPLNFLFPISLRNTTTNFPLFLRDIRWIERHRSTEEGEPRRYCIYAGSIYVEPVADAIYAMELLYRKKVTVPSMTGDSDVPIIDEIWHEAIVLAATYRGTRTFREPTKDTWYRDLKNYMIAHSEQYSEEEEDFDGGITPVI